MIQEVSTRVAELRGFASFFLALAFGAMFIGAMTLALRTPGNVFELGSAILALVVAVTLAVVAAALWLRARHLDRSTMIIRGGGRRFSGLWIDGKRVDGVVDFREDN